MVSGGLFDESNRAKERPAVGFVIHEEGEKGERIVLQGRDLELLGSY